MRRHAGGKGEQSTVTYNLGAEVTATRGGVPTPEAFLVLYDIPGREGSAVTCLIGCNVQLNIFFIVPPNTRAALSSLLPIERGLVLSNIDIHC